MRASTKTLKQQRHVVALPLEVNAREAHILDRQFQLVGKLKNAALATMISRVEGMQQDPRWQQAGAMAPGKERSRLYQDLKKRHLLRSHDYNACVFSHWQHAKWMKERLGSRIALTLGPEIAQNLGEWIYGRAECPAFKRSDTRDVIWNNDNKSGLLYAHSSGQVLWSMATTRKSLVLSVDFSGVSNNRRTYVNGRRIVRCEIQRQMIRGGVWYTVLLCVVDPPYRNREYLQNVEAGSQGLDLGPSQVAVVGEEHSEIYRLMSEDLEATRYQQAAKKRRVERAAQRSRAAANGHAIRHNGRCVKGVKQPQRTKRGRKRQE